MNEVLDNIYTRRSTRSFIKKKINFDTLSQIADAARYAPSANNMQKWKFTVIQNKTIINKLASEIAGHLNDKQYNFYNPDALILCSNERDYLFRAEDCSCAMQTIFLAANSLNIGSVWINQFQGNCDVPSIRIILNEIKIPENHIVIGCAALGYSENLNQFKADKRNDAVEYIL